MADGFVVTNIVVLAAFIAIFVSLHITIFRWRRSAVHDPLTGLFNIEAFEKKGDRLLRLHQRARFAFVVLEYRNYVQVSGIYGFSRGGKMIRDIGREIRVLGHFLPGKMIGARGFVNDFYILYEMKRGETREDFLSNFTQIMLTCQQQSLIDPDQKAGIVFVAEDTPRDRVSALASQALYAKKDIEDDSSRSYSVFGDDLKKKYTIEQQIESSFKKAVNNGEFYVVYQPQMNIITGRITGAEALARWKSPEYGELMPKQFIPVLEKNGQIEKLDFYVYTQVFEFIQRRLDAKLPIVPISVNMSRSHLNATHFIDEFMNLFRRYRIPANLVRIEIIERSADENRGIMQEITSGLQNRGFHVSIDDFGSGESSLNMLSQIPVDELKIDQRFISDAEQSEDSREIISSIVSLAKKLRKKTVCEGVETENQFEFLRSIDCGEIQGFYFSRPLSEQVFITYMEKNR